MTAETALVVLAIIAIIVFVLIYVPILAYYAYKVKQYEYHTVMAKRHTRLTIVLSVLSIAWIISFTFGICVFTFADNSSILLSISNFFIIAIYISFTYTLIWRLWFIYFNIIYNVSISHLSWQQLIHNEAGEKNWYIQAKTVSKWGNPQWVKKFILTLIFSTVLIYGIVYFLGLGTIGFIINLIINFLPWIGIIWIYNRIPSFHDDIGIAQEIKYVMRGYWIIGLLFICVIVIVASVKNTDIVLVILYNLAYHLLAFSAFATSMIMTWWPLKKFVSVSDNISGHYRGIGNDSPRKASTSEKMSFSGKDTRIHLKLEDICLSMFGMDLLMKFLEKEYSRENLLFIIEVTLLQKSILEHLEHNQRQYAKQNIDLSAIASNIFILPSTCPKSTLVEADYENIIEQYGGNNGQILSFAAREQIRFKKILYEIYRKYIAHSSELSINISSGERARIINLMQNEGKWMNNKEYNNIVKLVQLYQASKTEIAKLIKSDSLPRFKLKNDYQRIVEMIQRVKAQASEQQLAMTMDIGGADQGRSNTNKPQLVANDSKSLK